jgi:hypothetical protein
VFRVSHRLHTRNNKLAIPEGGKIASDGYYPLIILPILSQSLSFERPRQSQDAFAFLDPIVLPASDRA